MRQCLFCDQHVSSKEHAWPMWVLRLLQPLGVCRARIYAERQGVPPNEWAVVDGGITARFVCGNCNNRWMSDLETRVTPVVERLIADGITTLTADDQKVLSAWATKNAMVFEAFRGNRPRFYSQAERESLRESLVPPHRTTIWIAKCVDQPNAYSSASDLSGGVVGSGRPVTAYVTTMAFGGLGGQVLSGRLPDEIPRTATVTGDLRPGPWEQIAVRIHPPEAEFVRWPPPVALNGDVGIEAFSERWNPP